MGVYIVVASNNAAEIDVLEAYAGSEAALGRAWAVAQLKAGNDSYWITSTPPEEKLSDDCWGEARWVFLETSKNFVAVYYRKIETALLSKRDPVTISRDFAMPDASSVCKIAKTPAVTVPNNVTIVTVPNEKMNVELPGGWDRAGAAVTLRTVIEDPDELLPYDQLKPAQKRALTAARISKNPGWVMLWDNYIWTQQEALVELKTNTSPIVADRIIKFEIDWLDGIYQESLNC